MSEEITFEKLVKILSKPGEEIFATLEANDCHLLHMCLGLVSEIDEIIEHIGVINLIEELGDFEFYLEGVRQAVGIRRSELDVPTADDLDITLEYLLGIPSQVSKIIDIVKKTVIYRKEFDRVKMLKEMGALEYYLDEMRHDYKLSRAGILEANQKKLLTGDKARYKLGKYTDEQAQERSDKQE